MFGTQHNDQYQQPAVQPVPDDNLGVSPQTAPSAPAVESTPDYVDAITTTATPLAASDPAPAPSTPAEGANTDQLLDLKQQALQQLTPLVGHLEQDPEEKFRTTMMMIQAADNSSLIRNAYDAALQITDEKVRAQALLDIVNEINYFTHSKNDSDS